MHRIIDPADPRLAPYQTLKVANDPRRERLFVAEGELVVRQLLASTFRVQSLLLTPAKADHLAPLALANNPDAQVFVTEPGVIDQVIGYDFHRGVLALGERGPQADPLDLAAAAPLALVAQGVSNYDNMGGLFRTLSALAPQGSCLLVAQGCCDPLYRKVIRVSMGHALRVPFAVCPIDPTMIDRLRARGLVVAALTPHPRAIDLPEAAASLASARVALLVGAEGPGLPGDVIEASDLRIRIPMRAGVDSLNLVVAAGIALHALHAR